MSGKRSQDALMEFAKAGILFRTNAGQVFFITQEALNDFLLPEDFQAGGTASGDFFETTCWEDGKKFQTGDEFTAALDNHQKMGGLSGLRNAAYLPDGLMGKKGLTATGKFPFDAAKGGKPLDGLPKSIPTQDI